MRTLRTWIVCGLAIAWVAADGTAQIANARSLLEKVQSLRDDIKSDGPLDKIESAANRLGAAAEDLGRALLDVGANLKSASGAYSSERAAIFTQATMTRDEADRLKRRTKSLSDWTRAESEQPDKSNYKSELQNRCSDVASGIAMVVERWNALQRSIDDTGRWLRDGLSSATSLRDNAARPAEGLEQAEAQLWTRSRQLIDRLTKAMVACSDAFGRSAEAEQREDDCFKKWMAAIQSSGGDQFSEAASRAANAWLSTADEKTSALSREYETFRTMSALIEEKNRSFSEQSKACADLRDFCKQATSDTINRRFADFDQWTRIYQREFNR